MALSIYRVSVKPKKRGKLKVFTLQPKSLYPDEIVRYENASSTLVASMATYYYNYIKGLLCKELLGLDMEDLDEVDHDDASDYKQPMLHLFNFNNEGYIGPKAVKSMASFLKKKVVDDFTPQRLGTDEYYYLCLIIGGIVQAADNNEYLRFK